MRILSIIIFSMFATVAYGQSLPDASGALTLGMPSAPGNYQSDKFKANNLDCSNAIGSATNLEFGVMGLINQGDYYDALNNYINTPFRDVGVYARIVIPLGQKPRARIDCNRLFELELQARELEVIKLQRELDALKSLEFGE